MENIKSYPKYWDLHKQIYFNQLDLLDDYTRQLVTNNPNDIVTIKFHKDVDKKVAQKIEERMAKAE